MRILLRKKRAWGETIGYFASYELYRLATFKEIIYRLIEDRDYFLHGIREWLHMGGAVNTQWLPKSKVVMSLLLS